MRPRTIIAIFLGLCAAGILWHEGRHYYLLLFLHGDGKLAYLAQFEQSLDVYGVVLEQQSQQPVAGATVKFSPTDHPGILSRDSPPTTLLTDSQGCFAYTGHRGLFLYVTVQKDGYYNLLGSSVVAFVHAPEASRREMAFAPDSAHPARLYLRKQGIPAANLVQYTASKRLPLDGSPCEIQMASGNEVLIGTGDLRVECTGTNAGVPVGKQYKWHCRISVPGGGLQERTGTFDFQAPESGYQPSVEVDMPASLSREQWQYSYQHEFFFHLGNGCYARGEIDVHPERDHFFVLDYVYNLVPGDRNLEVGARPRP